MSSFIRLDNQPMDPSFQRSSTNRKPLTSDFVSIPKSEYESLLQISHHFKKVKESLLNGGLSQETLDILIYGVSSSRPNVHHEGNENERSHGHRTSYNGKSENYHRQPHKNPEFADIDDDDGDDVLTDSHGDEKDDYGESSGSNGSCAAQADQRTVMIRGLPDRITHKDIVQVMKGGALLHIYLRAREHTASVSFVDEAAAQEFLRHSKTCGLYIAGKKVETLWNDRQFYLPPFVRAKINNGASRNLLIENINPSITEGLIRKDLDHIHNLIVISVKFKHGNAYISTNSVHNALFARSCMMSRFTYRGMRISFYPDECREQLAKTPTTSKKDLSAPRTKSIAAPNRFHLLSLDGTEDEESEDHYDGLSTSTLNESIHWADNRVSA